MTTEHEPGPEEDVEPQAPQDNRVDQLVWLVWWGGTILIVLSWMDIVANIIGWVGFGICCASSLFSVVANKYWRFPRGGA